MGNNLKKRINKFARLVIVSLFYLSFVQVLNACSHLPDWMGESKKDSGIKGTRISVLELGDDIAKDSTLSQLTVSIPDPVPNSSWYKSYGHPYAMPENPSLMLPLGLITKVSASSVVDDDQHIKTSPVIAEGKVFIISADGKVSAFYENNIRKRLWLTKLKFNNKEKKYLSAAGISYYKGRIYAASGYNQVDALDAATGKIIWTKNLNGIARAAPDFWENTVFVSTIDNKIYALDIADGKVLWNHTGGHQDLSMFGSASPVVYEDKVIAPYSSGEVYALKAIDGREMWSDVFARRTFGLVKTLSDIDASPLVKNDAIFVVSSDGVLASSDFKTGKRIWEKAVSGRQTPWIIGEFLYLITSKNEVVCVYMKTGGIKWVKQLKNYAKVDAKKDPISWSGPVMAGGILWVVGSNGTLIGLSPFEGANKYIIHIPKNIYNPPVVAGGKMYLYSDDGYLVQVSGGSVVK